MAASLGVHQRDVAFTQHGRTKDAADVGDARLLARREQLLAHGRGQAGQLAGGLFNNLERSRVAGLRGFVDKFGKCGDARPRIVCGIEAVQQIVGVARARGLDQHAVQNVAGPQPSSNRRAACNARRARSKPLPLSPKT